MVGCSLAPSLQLVCVCVRARQSRWVGGCSLEPSVQLRQSRWVVKYE